MHKLVLLRHGESQWNKENRFTGRADVDLSVKGIQEAEDAGDCLKKPMKSYYISDPEQVRKALAAVAGQGKIKRAG